jgi:hypothetical protein
MIPLCVRFSEKVPRNIFQFSIIRKGSFALSVPRKEPRNSRGIPEAPNPETK